MYNGALIMQRRAFSYDEVHVGCDGVFTELLLQPILYVWRCRPILGLRVDGGDGVGKCPLLLLENSTLYYAY